MMDYITSFMLKNNGNFSISEDIFVAHSSGNNGSNRENIIIKEAPF